MFSVWMFINISKAIIHYWRPIHNGSFINHFHAFAIICWTKEAVLSMNGRVIVTVNCNKHCEWPPPPPPCTFQATATSSWQLFTHVIDHCIQHIKWIDPSASPIISHNSMKHFISANLPQNVQLRLGMAVCYPIGQLFWVFISHLCKMWIECRSLQIMQASSV